MSDEQRNLNRLLAALPAEEYAQLEPHLEAVTLSLGEILYEPPDLIRNAYFPTSSVISFLTEMPNGDSVEVGLTGREGLAGVDVILGAGKATKVATVQGAGGALKIATPALREAFNHGGRLQQYLLQYTRALMSQISASVLCNVRHTIDGRLARWLLMYCDSFGQDEFYLTHEFMANMLGVRRASVSVIAKQLQDEGLITYNRGQFRLTDRAGLEHKTCECYPVVKEEMDGLYSGEALGQAEGRSVTI
jgi:CRP-like cAMP-binding protein